MTIFLSILILALLFVAYGVLMRGRAGRAGQGCGCGAVFGLGGCGSCPNADGPETGPHGNDPHTVESSHDRR